MPKATKTVPVISDAEQAKQKLFEGKELPEVVSVGFAKVPDTNTYVSYVIKTRGYEVTSIEAGEPNMKIIVEESSKIDFVNSFILSEEI